MTSPSAKSLKLLLVVCHNCLLCSFWSVHKCTCDRFSQPALEHCGLWSEHIIGELISVEAAPTSFPLYEAQFKKKKRKKKKTTTNGSVFWHSLKQFHNRTDLSCQTNGKQVLAYVFGIQAKHAMPNASFLFLQFCVNTILTQKSFTAGSSTKHCHLSKKIAICTDRAKTLMAFNLRSYTLIFY